VLKSYDALVSVFILGDTDKKIARTAEIYQVSLEKAEALNLHNDRVRKLYHNHYCDGKWGDSRNYQLCINSSRIGIDETVAVIERYIQAKMEK
jgi:cytidylate kinase